MLFGLVSQPKHLILGVQDDVLLLGPSGFELQSCRGFVLPNPARDIVLVDDNSQNAQADADDKPKGERRPGQYLLEHIVLLCTF